MARTKFTKKSIDQATPMKNTIEMKNQYVPTPKITTDERKQAIESRLVSGSVTVNREIVNLPCGPLPACNTVETDQVNGLEQFIIDTVGAGTTTNDISNVGLVITSNVNGVSDNTDITDEVQALIDDSIDDIATTNDISNTGLVITSTVNGQSDSTNLTSAVQSLVDTSVANTTNDLSNVGLVVTSNVNGKSDSINLTTPVQNAINATVAPINTSITNINSNISTLQGTAHVPATMITNGALTHTSTGTNSQTFTLGLNIGQLPSGDSNNQVVLGSDGKLFVPQNTISTSGFNTVTTIAIRDAQTGLSDGFITQVTADPTPANNGFYIFESTTSTRTELVPNASVISVNGKTGSVVLIPSDVTYVATIDGVNVNNIQEALDELVSFVNGTAVQSVTGNLVDNTDSLNPVVNSANPGSYNNLTSLLVADNLQDAIDEVDANIDALDIRVDTAETDIDNIDTRVTNLENAGFVKSVTGNIVDNTDPENPVVDSTLAGSYDNTISGLTADNIQEAIDEIDNRIDILETIQSVASYKNTEIAGKIAGATYTLPSTPSGDIQVSIKGGIIQSETTPDYTHASNSATFTMSGDRVGQTVMISYIEAQTVNPVLSAKKGPITWSPAGSSLVIVDANSNTTSVVNGDNITSGAPNGNYFTYNTSTPGQITVTSRDFLGNAVSENGLTFYYSITY